MINVNDLIGKTYNRLTVVKFHGRIKRRPFLECLCSCGTPHIVNLYNVLNGHVKSCGCLVADTMLTRNKTHGRTRTKEYRAWTHAKDRCYRVNDPRYPNYGGRGIRMCDRWLKSFENFFADMGLAPTKKHTLDRKENNKDYGPDNCRWVTYKVQGNNKSTNTLLTHNGQTKTLTEWADSAGITSHVLRYRLKTGWPFDIALSKPLRNGKNGPQKNWKRSHNSANFNTIPLPAPLG